MRVLDDEGDEQPEQREDGKVNPKGLVYNPLLGATASLHAFRSLYESLSDVTVKHFLAAGHEKSADRIMSDIAVMKYELGNYTSAAMFFKRVSPVYADSGWSYVEAVMLKMHTHCLRELGRKREFVDMVLILLAKEAARGKKGIGGSN